MRCDGNENETIVMRGRVMRIMNDDILVRDRQTGQDVLVHTDRACCFRPGDCVRIEYGGMMTMSIPPQISAERICRAACRF